MHHHHHHHRQLARVKSNVTYSLEKKKSRPSWEEDVDIRKYLCALLVAGEDWPFCMIETANTRHVAMAVPRRDDWVGPEWRTQDFLKGRARTEMFLYSGQ